MTARTQESLGRFRREYASALVGTIEEAVGPLAKLDALRLSRIVTSLDDARIESLLSSVIRVHSDHASVLHEYVRSSAPDEVVVLDPSAGLPPPKEVSRLLLYAETLVWPDPLLEHSLALRHLVPDDLGAAIPRTLEQRQEELHSALEFYQQYRYPILEGLITPAAWNVLLIAQRSCYQNWLGPAHVEAPWDTLPTALLDLADSEVDVRSASFDGRRHTLHGTPPDARSSLIALVAKGDPSDQGEVRIESHMSIVDHGEEHGHFMVRAAQTPPSDLTKWVTECRRKLVYNRVVSLGASAELAAQLGGAVLTRSATNQKILDSLVTPFAQARSALAMTTMELPTVEGLSVNRIVHARKDSAALQNFRVGFRKACSAIKSATGSPEFQRECEAIARDTVEHGVEELRQSYRALRAKSARELSLSTALVTLSFAGISLGQLQLLPALAGAMTQLRSIFDAVSKEDELRRHPYFLLWNTSRRPFSP